MMSQKVTVPAVCKALALVVLVSTLALLTGCVAPFSELQSARLVGKGNFEVTPSYSAVSMSDEGQTEKIQDHYGAQIGFGLAKFMDLRLRYEHIGASYEVEGELQTASVDVIGFGPKFGLAKDWLAFYVPIGFAFGGDVEDSSESWQIHPTLLATLALGKSFELIPSTKVMISLTGGGALYAFNLGAAIGPDVRKWAIRPEFGICSDFAGGSFMQFSIGLTLGPGLFK